VKLILKIALGVVLSFTGAWVLAGSLCSGPLLGLRAYDFVCGHNIYVQMFPEFLVFLAILSTVARCCFRLQARSGQ